MDNGKLFSMPFPRVYSCLLAKAERRGRTEQELRQVITWLTGWQDGDIRAACDSGMPYGDFFRLAPAPNPARLAIRGSICGVRVEEIEDPILREIRYLDKLTDELAKGRTMDKILRRL